MAASEYAGWPAVHRGWVGRGVASSTAAEASKHPESEQGSVAKACKLTRATTGDAQRRLFGQVVADAPGVGRVKGRRAPAEQGWTVRAQGWDGRWLDQPE